MKLVKTDVRVGAAGFAALLVERGLVNKNDLVVAEQHAIREHIELACAVVALGLAIEPAVYAVLSEASGLELVDLEAMQLSELAIRLVPERVARRHAVVPIRVDNRTLTYATARPFDAEAERDLGFASGRRAAAVLATNSAITDAMDRSYPKLRDLDRLVERLRTEQPAKEEVDESAGHADSTVIDLCNHLLNRAIDCGASDVHIDFSNTGAIVRYRICGVLEQVLTLPAAASHPVRNRFKIMAKADIAVRLRPQDGSFRMKSGARAIDVRLSSLPTVDGEKLVMRIIDSQSPLQSLDKLGYDAETLARLERALSRPDGLVMVTGPTGSGKTTALYAALGHLRTGETNIVSVEDPVERALPGVTQIGVNAKAGNTFPAILRSLLRQDPNIIMVGEVRDAEVAQIVGQAAYTGHLVLTSLHTVDTATAITRLTNLGLEPFKVAETLAGVLAQRLVRRLCSQCRRHNADASSPYPYLAGPGCDACKHTGYSGRVPVAELLTPSESLRSTIARGATAYEIRAAMHADGIPTMRDQAVKLAEQGVTSIEEVNRVLAEEAPDRANSGRTRVLVSEDDRLTRMLVKLLLEKEHFEVLEAANGQQAIDIALREKPDLLITDLNMPEMDGYEAIGRLRRDLSLAMMPILVLTAEDGPGVEERVLALGADDYLIKPFDPALLLARVNAVFRRLRAVAA
jgi:type IV pilus assembly protein PilB